MIPRPAQIQGKLRQGIEPLDFRGQKVVHRVSDARLFAHGFSLGFGVTAKLSLTIGAAWGEFSPHAIIRFAQFATRKLRRDLPLRNVLDGRQGVP
jgi:hypothetical protein